jgi:hypothetical protein
MQIIIAIVCLGLLMWVEPASAQTTHSLKVSRHPNVELSDRAVDAIFVEATEIMRKNSCEVKFRRDGPVQTFASSNTPEKITDRTSRDAVHREDSDVKVVSAIEFCRENGQHAGCAWDPLRPGQRPQHRSMIVVPQPTTKFAGILWAHEFGHRTGLFHRSAPDALMTKCDLLLDLVIPQEKVSGEECHCFLGGPGSCRRRERQVKCPISLRR